MLSYRLPSMPCKPFPGHTAGTTISHGLVWMGLSFGKAGLDLCHVHGVLLHLHGTRQAVTLGQHCIPVLKHHDYQDLLCELPHCVN